eukprot:tig00021433_g21286.t1
MAFLTAFLATMPDRVVVIEVDEFQHDGSPGRAQVISKRRRPPPRPGDAFQASCHPELSFPLTPACARKPDGAAARSLRIAFLPVLHGARHFRDASQAFSPTRPSASRHSHWEARQSTLAERGLKPLESTREGSRFRAFPECALSPSYRRVPAPPGLQELPPPKNDDAMLHTTRARLRLCGGGALLPLRAPGGNGWAGNGEGRTFLCVAQTGVVHS